MKKYFAVLLMCCCLSVGAQGFNVNLPSSSGGAVNNGSNSGINSMNAAIAEYENDNGDVEAAMEYFAAQAQSGNADAMYYLGMGYVDGDGVEQDLDQAYNWLEKAGQNGCPSGYVTLGVLFSQGAFGNEDEQTAVAYFQKAAQAGEPEGMIYLGLAYMNGQGGLPKDANTGKQWIQNSCKAGFSYACDMVKNMQ